MNVPTNSINIFLSHIKPFNDSNKYSRTQIVVTVCFQIRLKERKLRTKTKPTSSSMDFHVQNIDSRKPITQWGSCPSEARLREINGSQSVTFLGGSFTGRVVELASRSLPARFSRYFERVKITHGHKAK